MSRQPDSGELDCHLPSLLEHVMDTKESDLFFSAVTIPVYLELARLAVGEGFQSAGEAMRWTKPGWGGQPLHADGPAGIFARSGHPAPGQWPVINSLLMLSEFPAKTVARSSCPSAITRGYYPERASSIVTWSPPKETPARS